MNVSDAQSVDDLVGGLIEDYEEMGDQFADDRVGTICDMVVDDLRHLQDELTDGVFEPAAPGDPTVVEKPDNPSRKDTIRAQLGTHVVAQTTELMFGSAVVGLDAESGDLIVAVDEADIREYAEGNDDEDDGDYDNPRFGSPK